MLPLLVFACSLGAIQGSPAHDSLDPSPPSTAGGSPWTGNMHPKLGFDSNPACNATTLQGCFPTYDTLAAAGELWQCPAGSPSNASCGGDGSCVVGSGENPVCANLSAAKPCCCPKPGCHTTPNFNTVIGVCKGAGCGCGDASAASCGNGKCGSSCSGEVVPCCFGNDVSGIQAYMESEVVLNYWAAYTFDVDSGNFSIAEESSFNTNAERPPSDLMKPYGGLSPDEAWLAPQPGGSVYWSLGYYPAGVQGVGLPAAMFVLSTEQLFWATWYMLNQLTLDRGPGSTYPADKCPITNDNCWASGNAGEMDFLEPSWSVGNASSTHNGRASFSTQWNQVGRCFIGGVNEGGFTSPNELLTSPRAADGSPLPFVYVAVVDQVGVWVYRIPGDDVESIWPGLSRRSAEASVSGRPAVRPDAVNPCLGNGFCLVFTSACVAKTWSEAAAFGCGYNRQQGFCGNWNAAMVDTQQPLFPGEDCEKDVRGGVTMPWCKAMVP